MRMQELYHEDWDQDIDSDDTIDKNLIIGYQLPTIETYHKLKLERTKKTKRMIDQIEEATSLEFQIRESMILQQIQMGSLKLQMTKFNDQQVPSMMRSLTKTIS